MDVNLKTLVAHTIAVGVGVGVAAAIAAPAHADVTLSSVDDPLSGSDTAMILGPSLEPTLSTPAAQAVEDLYLHPLGFDGGALDSTVCDMIGTDPCSAPLQVLTTPDLAQQDHSLLTGASDVVLAVENEFKADPGAFSAEHPLTVFGYSQSVGAESVAMTQLADAGIPSDDLHFVFIGDPDLAGGAYPNIDADLIASLGPSLGNAVINFADLNGVSDLSTPTDLYPTTIYTLAGDGAADWQADYNANGLLGAAGDVLLQHVEYLGLTPDQIADATTSTDGDLTYVDISDSDVNNLTAWVDATLVHDLAFSGLFQSLFQSLEFAFTNSF
jgi:hypothetical protein